MSHIVVLAVAGAIAWAPFGIGTAVANAPVANNTSTARSATVGAPRHIPPLDLKALPGETPDRPGSVKVELAAGQYIGSCLTEAVKTVNPGLSAHEVAETVQRFLVQIEQESGMDPRRLPRLSSVIVRLQVSDDGEKVVVLYTRHGIQPAGS